MAQSHVDVASSRVIGSYPRYLAAQRVVDRLADAKFPVEYVSIIGKDVRITEKVTGRLTVSRAALAGTATGTWLGLFIGFVFWIVSPWAPEALESGVLLGVLRSCLGRSGPPPGWRPTRLRVSVRTRSRHLRRRCRRGPPRGRDAHPRLRSAGADERPSAYSARSNP
jgi:hypothetical protein